MQLRKFKLILIKGYYCLGPLEHGGLKSACTNNIFFFFFLFDHRRGIFWALGIAGRCVGVYYCANHQVWCGVISGVCDRRTHPQMSLLTSCKACSTAGLSFLLLANVQIALQTVTQSLDLLLGYSCLNEFIRRALPSWSHPNHNWNLSKCWPVAAPSTRGAWPGSGGCIASWGFFYYQT